MQSNLTTAAVLAALALAAALPLAIAGSPAPRSLSETGLYANWARLELRADVLPFSPQYPLWSDGAVKRRWIALPPGGTIDASQPGAWEFPSGTRLWKEFSVNGRRVETRLIERLTDGDWRFASYAWSADGREAVLAPPEGIPALPISGGGSYAIPSEADCRACHEGAPVPVLGFSALQLSADRDPLAPHAEPRRPGEPDLRALAERGWLVGIAEALIEMPPRIDAPTPAGRAVLGYLHGNCGHCHSSPEASLASVPVALQLALDPREAGEGESAIRALLKGPARTRLPGGTEARLLWPGDAASSLLLMRMRSPDPRMRMPPIGTVLPDSAAIALIERWINHELPVLEGDSP